MEWSTLVLTSISSMILIYFLFFQKLNKMEKLGILHIKPLPIFGNMASTLFRQCSFHDTIRRVYNLDDEAKYVGFYDFGEPVIMIKSPELIKNITIKHFHHFVNHRGFVDAHQDPFFGNNLFSLRDEKWREMRSLLSPAFTSSKMKAMFKLISNCAKNFTDYLTESTLDDSPKILNAKDAFTRYASDVIATCAFGIKIDSMRNPTNDFYVLGSGAANFEGFLSVKLFLLRSFPRISKFFNLKLVSMKVQRFFEDIVRDTIETRVREGITRPDMIQLMMESRGDESDDGPGLTITDMTAQAFLFFFGGFDTTSTLICFAAFEIANNPNVQKMLQDEIDEILKETEGDLTYEAINGMKYLDAVVNESLRLHPGLGILDRICVKRYKLPPARPGDESIIIEPGQSIWFPVHPMHHDEHFFYEPETFNPERFIGKNKNNIEPFTYYPFGQGPRMCIGSRFALLEIKCVLFHLLSKSHIKTSERMILPLKLTKSSFAPAPVGGFWLQLESRDALPSWEPMRTGSDV